MEDDQYPVRTFDDVKRLLDDGCEMVYLHDADGKGIGMIIPNDGWWASHLPKEAPLEHFDHDHVYPWGEPEYKPASSERES